MRKPASGGQKQKMSQRKPPEAAYQRSTGLLSKHVSFLSQKKPLEAAYQRSTGLLSKKCDPIKQTSILFSQKKNARTSISFFRARKGRRRPRTKGAHDFYTGVFFELEKAAGGWIPKEHRTLFLFLLCQKSQPEARYQRSTGLVSKTCVFEQKQKWRPDTKGAQDFYLIKCNC